MTQLEALELIDDIAKILLSPTYAREKKIEFLFDYLIELDVNIAFLWITWLTSSRQISYHINQIANAQKLFDKLNDVLATKYRCIPGAIHNVTDFINLTYLNPKCNPKTIRDISQELNHGALYFMIGERLTPEQEDQFKSLTVRSPVHQLFYCFTGANEAMIFKLTYG